MIRVIVAMFCLIASFAACSEKKETKSAVPPGPAVSAPQGMTPGAPFMAPPMAPSYGPGQMPGQVNRVLYRPSSFFADINNNNILEPDELKAFEEAKFYSFDTDQNGVLDKKEMENFDVVDLILSRGGEDLIQLNDEQKESYKVWRSFILSLKIKNPAGSAFSDESFAKCYPDKICDDAPGANAPGIGPVLPPSAITPVQTEQTKKK